MGAGPGKIPGVEFIGWAIIWILVGVVVIILAVAFQPRPANARDDGRYAGSALKPWFDSLRSGNGPCCSDADGTALSDPDWESSGDHYRVMINGEWVDVPADALISVPNLYGQAMVWPHWLDGKPQIRCFIPGAAG